MSYIKTGVIEKNEQVISGNTFVVKDYQRGYRWKEKQVWDLLDDLDEWNDPYFKYCLQPLVVKKLTADSIDETYKKNNLKAIIEQEFRFACECDSGEYWEVIDGQQRLTTLYLIFNFCYGGMDKIVPYEIIYTQTRNTDKYYILKAMDTIKKWFMEHATIDTVDQKKEEIIKKIIYKTQFIWYQVETKANSVEVFTKINRGKIPLTSAELFKAMLLNYDNLVNLSKFEADKQKIELTKIAIEWDNIEKTLHDEDFWWFIANSDEDSETRIDYLLRLYAYSQEEEKVFECHINKEDKLYPFLVINNLIKRNKKRKTPNEIWEGIVAIFETLQEWYNDIILYHKIGYLLSFSKEPISAVQKLFKKLEGKSKSEARRAINNEIKQSISLRDLDFEELDYDSALKVRKALLLFNVHTMIKDVLAGKIKSNTEVGRFSFKAYKDKNEKWDIEHIHARATDEKVKALKDKKERLEFLNSYKSFYKDTQKASMLESMITRCEDKGYTCDEFLEDYKNLVGNLGYNVNGIGNLTLLNASINREFHNDFFNEKQKVIIKHIKNGRFIPVATTNVFLKMYSCENNDSFSLAWTEKDYENYSKEIKHTLEEYGLCQ